MAKEDYIERNKQWLAAKSGEAGVLPLDKGVYYKVIKKGNASGPVPGRSSVVTMHYVGKTINGKTFDSSRGGTPPAFRVRDLIPGMMFALTRMHPGDRWEVYIPAAQGYGRFNQPGIPGGSTLVFDLELIGLA